MAKYASRFALGLSNSIPGLLLERAQIEILDDIGMCRNSVPGVPLTHPTLVSSAGSDMTDGAGLINDCGMREIYQKIGWDIFPSAIQVRLLGSKVGSIGTLGRTLYSHY